MRSLGWQVLACGVSDHEAAIVRLQAERKHLAKSARVLLEELAESAGQSIAASLPPEVQPATMHLLLCPDCRSAASCMASSSLFENGIFTMYLEWAACMHALLHLPLVPHWKCWHVFHVPLLEPD